MSVEDILIDAEIFSEFQRIHNLLYLHISAYEDRCKLLFIHISKIEYENSNEYFDDLFALQKSLAFAQFKYNYEIKNINLKAFVYHFDRDDEYSRKYWFEKIIQNLQWKDLCKLNNEL